MSDPNVDPAAVPDRPIAVGAPAAEAQEHPPVWDARGKQWDYVAEMGGWVCERDPLTLCRDVGSIPREFQPTYAYPPPHPPRLPDVPPL
jgi:hypothetical protein